MTAVSCDPDAAVVFVGSWGRGEVTSGSDDDYLVLVNADSRELFAPSVPAVHECLKSDPKGFGEPGAQGTFGDVVFKDSLQTIGLEEDPNSNLTQRMLLLLESVAIAGEPVLQAFRRELVELYLSSSPRAFRPPRFLLNDVIRYWRTIGVDFAAKVRGREPKWGLRNAKLRTSRKLLFASGLLPILRCHEYGTEEIPGFLLEQLSLLPLDRLADAFLQYDDLAHGAQTLGAYDQFLRLLDGSANRDELKSLEDLKTARQSRIFGTVVDLGHEIDDGLLGLLFGPALRCWTERFGLL